MDSQKIIFQETRKLSPIQELIKNYRKNSFETLETLIISSPKNDPGSQSTPTPTFGSHIYNHLKN